MKFPIKIITILALLSTPFFSGAQHSPDFDNGVIRYMPVNLSQQDRQIIQEELESQHARYDEKEHMLTRKIDGYNYHTDAETGTFHEVRASFNYAVRLLDSGDERFQERAFRVIEATIALQDTNSTSRYRGVWPYYKEEPLSTKKSPVDFNWADFNAVSLLDVYMGHYGKLPRDLKHKIAKALVYAGKSVQKRNVQPGYTNIAIMGTYVTFMVSHLFDLPEMQQYSKQRLDNFYKYTLERGYTEYNSPTYTIVALDELDRMKRHIVDRNAKPMIDSLYNLGWEVIAKHYHKPTAQWAGPHSRSYRTLLPPTLYGILKQASDGKINLPGATPRGDVKVKHQIPAYLMDYFLNPEYPRVQRDEFTIDDPKIVGTTYLTNQYAFSSASRSSLWNQRRPFLVYWGSQTKPHYLQLRFLHDGYDFSSSSFYSAQNENSLLGGIGFLTNGGDKHISIDRLKDGKVTAKDFRMRFEFSDPGQLKNLKLPERPKAPFELKADGLTFGIHLFETAFDGIEGYWEKGSDEKTAWLDYVVYSGDEKSFDLNTMKKAVLAFTFAVSSEPGKPDSRELPKSDFSDEELNAVWKGLNLKVPAKPIPQPRNL